MTVSQLEVPGGSIHVIDEGDGPPLVLLHAGIADSRSWDAMAPLLVSAGYRVVRYDQRPFGRSTSEPVEFKRTDDLRAVMDALGIARAVLVGNSRGGMLAFDGAIEMPERVVAVVGVGAGLGGYDGGETPEEAAIFTEQEAIDKARPFSPAALTAFEVRMWVDGPGQPETRVPAAIRDLVYEMDLPLNGEDLIGGKEIRLDPPANDRLAELRCPVLAIAGRLDFSEVAATARRLEADAPDARAVIWDDVAHMIGMEQPERLTEAITGFVGPFRPWG